VYWRGLKRKPTDWLFPGNRWHTASHPVSTKVLWHACQQAAQRAGLEHKRIHPHTLRHCFATHLLKPGADLRTIWMLRGHRDLEETTIYLHLSRRHLSATGSPLDCTHDPKSKESRRRPGAKGFQRRLQAVHRVLLLRAVQTFVVQVKKVWIALKPVSNGEPWASAATGIQLSGR